MTAELTERSYPLKGDMVNKWFGLSDSTIDGNKASTPEQISSSSHDLSSVESVVYSFQATENILYCAGGGGGLYSQRQTSTLC